MALSRETTTDVILSAKGELDLRERNLSNRDVDMLCKVISTSDDLVILSLYNVRLSSDDAVLLARALEFNSTLATLNFEHNPIGEVGIASLAEVIKFNEKIRTVSLASTVLHPKGCALLADALFMNRTLSSLNLEKNRVGAEGAAYLANALRGNESLEELALDGNGIGDSGAISLSEALSPAGGSRMKRLTLCKNDITEIGAAALGDALTENEYLEILVMAKQNLAPQILRGRRKTSAGSTSPRGLQVIDLSGQSLSATLDFPILCRLVAGNRRLARLNLSRSGLCGVTTAGRGRRSIAGPQALALTLRACPPRLVVLDVGYCMIDDTAMDIIARGLEHNHVLTTLFVRGNDLTGQGVAAIACRLPSSIVDVDLSDNPNVRKGGGSAVARFLMDYVRSANIRKLNMSRCRLDDAGLENLAEGVASAPELEWLDISGNTSLSSLNGGGSPGSGKMALGRTLMDSEESRLQGLSCDLWSVTKGQKELKLVRAKGVAACQLPSPSDVCLLAGVLSSHEWLRSLVLDGNPLDEEGLGYLCRALMRNKTIERVSLRRCGLGETSGLLLLKLLDEKPGLEVECQEGNPFGDDVQKKLNAALVRSRTLLSAREESRRTTVHLLGEAGTGKSTLIETLTRGFLSSYFYTSKENATDKGASDTSQRTKGVASSNVALGSGSAHVLVREHGGMSIFRGLGALDGGLMCPTSVYIVMISLIADKWQQTHQIKYWLRLIQTTRPSSGCPLLLVGSRADQMGSVCQEYLQKLWDRAREDLTREELRAGIDATMPTFAGCLALDCRKATDSSVTRLREMIAHADRLFGEEKHGWMVPRIHRYAISKVEHWVGRGARMVRWNDFIAGIQRRLCPRASGVECAELAHSLAREGRILAKQRKGGRGWVLLDADFFLHNVLGGVYSAIQADDSDSSQRRGDNDTADKSKTCQSGVVPATWVCDSIIGGLNQLPREELVQMLLDTDICAEVMPEEPLPEEAALSDDWDAKTMVSSVSEQNSTMIDEIDLNSEDTQSIAGSGVSSLAVALRRSARATKRKKDPVRIRLELRRLVFPALLPFCENTSDKIMEELFGHNRGFMAGRRVECRSPILLPGLYQLAQARLANRYSGNVRLHRDVTLVDLAALDKARGENGAAGSALLQMIRSDLPGRDFIDVVVGGGARKVSFLALLKLRAILEEVLLLAPTVQVEDLVISGKSLEERASPAKRFVAPMLQLIEELEQGHSECLFGEGLSPESLSDLLWQGPEEFAIDESGRVVTDAVATSKASPLVPKQSVKRVEVSSGRGSARGGAANPFAPGFDERERETVASGSPCNPFGGECPAKQLRDVPASDGNSNGNSNPFAPSSPTTDNERQRDDLPQTLTGRAGEKEIDRDAVCARQDEAEETEDIDEESDEESDGERDSSGNDEDGNEIMPLGATHISSSAHISRPPSLAPRQSNPGMPPLEYLEQKSGTQVDKRDEVSTAETGGRRSFTFGGEIFRDAETLFAPYLKNRSYMIDRQRVEITVRAPGAFRLGIWLPPADEREEREREKAKGKPSTIRPPDDRDTPIGGERSDTTSATDDVADHASAMYGARTTPRDRPGIVDEVLDEGVLGGFNTFGSSQSFPLVGCAIAAVSTNPFDRTEVSKKVLTYEEAVAALNAKRFPLFVQLCRPPMLFSPEPEYPPVKLVQTLMFSNRVLEKVNGEYRLGQFISEDPRPRWYLATTAVPTTVGDLGTGMFVGLNEYHVVGMYLLTQEEVMDLITQHSSRDVFMFVHGFNTPVGFGIRSAAVLQRALKKPLCVCLAWPSDPPGEGAGWLIKQVMSTYERRYTYCEHNMHASIFRFLEVSLDIKAAADAGRKSMCWKGHSMGCYLLLNIVDRMRWKGEGMKGLFNRVILDAPDVPTWFFRSMTKLLADNGVVVGHYFNPGDNAIHASCTRRALERPVPGQDAIVAHERIQGVLCDKARSSTGMNHDYGRVDGRCLLDQREFLAGESPDMRVLEERISAEGVPSWRLKT